MVRGEEIRWNYNINAAHVAAIVYESVSALWRINQPNHSFPTTLSIFKYLSNSLLNVIIESTLSTHTFGERKYICVFLRTFASDIKPVFSGSYPPCWVFFSLYSPHIKTSTLMYLLNLFSTCSVTRRTPGSLLHLTFENPHAWSYLGYQVHLE